MSLETIVNSVKDFLRVPSKRALLGSFLWAVSLQTAISIAQPRIEPRAIIPPPPELVLPPGKDAIDNSLRFKDRYLSVAGGDALYASYLNGLAIVESSGNPKAVNPSGARGLFQVTTSSGHFLKIKSYERFPERCALYTNETCYAVVGRRVKNKKGKRVWIPIPEFDNRTRPYPATYAGATILKEKLDYIQRNCGKDSTPEDQWLMAITAYNTGQGTVCAAAKKSGVTPPTFQALLPQFTPDLIQKELGFDRANSIRQARDARNFATAVLNAQKSVAPYYSQ